MADKKKLLSAEDILGADDVKTMDVDVPEWGGAVRLRTLSAEDAAQFMEDSFTKDKKNAAGRVFIMSAVKEDGTPMFTTDDLERLRKKSLRAINRVQKAALELNGLTDDKEKEAKND